MQAEAGLGLVGAVAFQALADENRSNFGFKKVVITGQQPGLNKADEQKNRNEFQCVAVNDDGPEA